MAKTPKAKDKDIFKCPVNLEGYFVLKNLVHFSSKTRNSKASPVGIRLTTKQALPMHMPYLSVRTLLNHESIVPFDNLLGGAVNIPYLKALNAQIKQEPSLPEDLKPILQQYVDELTSTSFELNTEDVIPARLRQIFVPHNKRNSSIEDENGFRLFTPLSAAGLSQRINETVLAFNQSVDELREKELRDKVPFDRSVAKLRRKIKRATMHFGGTQSQNATAIPQANSPIFIAPPSGGYKRRNAIGLFYKGLTTRNLRANRFVLEQFEGWLNLISNENVFNQQANNKLIYAANTYVTFVKTTVSKLKNELARNKQFLIDIGLVEESYDALVSESATGVQQALLLPWLGNKDKAGIALLLTELIEKSLSKKDIYLKSDQSRDICAALEGAL